LKVKVCYDPADPKSSEFYFFKTIKLAEIVIGLPAQHSSVMANSEIIKNFSPLFFGLCPIKKAANKSMDVMANSDLFTSQNAQFSTH
jgi:hypothetical protein